MTHSNEFPGADEIMRIERQAQRLRAEALARIAGSARRGLIAIPARIGSAMRRAAHG